MTALVRELNMEETSNVSGGSCNHLKGKAKFGCQILEVAKDSALGEIAITLYDEAVDAINDMVNEAPEPAPQPTNPQGFMAEIENMTVSGGLGNGGFGGSSSSSGGITSFGGSSGGGGDDRIAVVTVEKIS